MIKIDFEIQNEKYGVYRDALHLPADHTFTEEEIESMKQERYDKWLDVIENPPVIEQSETTQTSEPPDTININGDEYILLNGTPPTGSKIIEINGTWYVKKED